MKIGRGVVPSEIEKQIYLHIFTKSQKGENLKFWKINFSAYISHYFLVLTFLQHSMSSAEVLGIINDAMSRILVPLACSFPSSSKVGKWCSQLQTEAAFGLFWLLMSLKLVRINNNNSKQFITPHNYPLPRSFQEKSWKNSYFRNFKKLKFLRFF